MVMVLPGLHTGGQGGRGISEETSKEGKSLLEHVSASLHGYGGLGLPNAGRFEASNTWLSL